MDSESGIASCFGRGAADDRGRVRPDGRGGIWHGAEVEVAEMVDETLLVLVPGMGDDVQSLKAGVMEVADLYVVNKGDLPGADRVEAEVRAMQSLVCEDGGWVPPVLRTVAITGEGVPELLRAVEEFLAQRATR